VAEAHGDVECILKAVDLSDLQPKSNAMAELIRLSEHEEQLRARIDDVDRAARAATAELAAAREALVELERQAGTGKVSPQARRKAEERLDRAEQAAGERWAERRTGAVRAGKDGSDGTRTRDLRRDRPRQAWQRVATRHA